MDGVLRDVRFGLRLLRLRPLFSFGAILSLALAIGLNSAVFGVASSTLLKPLDVPEAGRLIRVYGYDPKLPSRYWHFTYPDFRDLRTRVRSVERLAAFSRFPLSIMFDTVAERVSGEVVTGNFFDILRVKPVVGRLIGPQDDDASAPPVVVVSEDLWRDKFKGELSAIGRDIEVAGRPHRVVGVVPSSYDGLVKDWLEQPDVWVSVETYLASVAESRRLPLTNYVSSWLLPVGRLKPGMSRNDASEDLNRVMASLKGQAPGSFKYQRLDVFSAARGNFHPGHMGKVLRTLAGLAAIVGLILLLACSNVMNLLLERAIVRRNEIATRFALGAQRTRIVRQLLAESLVLAFLASSIGLLLAPAFSEFLLLLPRPLGVPLSYDVRLDEWTLTFTVLAAMFTTVLFGVAPALIGTRVSLASVLRNGGQGPTTPRRLTLAQDGLVILQVTVSVILLIGCGFFMRSLSHSYGGNLAYRPEQLMLLSVDLTPSGYDMTQRGAFLMSTMDRIRRLPGLEAATLTWIPPASSDMFSLDVAHPDEERGFGERIDKVHANVIGPDYFNVLGNDLLHGREFSDLDAHGAPRVAIVNQSFVRELWSNRDIVGRSLHLTVGGKRHTYEVVGVAQDTKYHTFWEAQHPHIYIPMFQTAVGAPYVLVRASEALGDVATNVRAELKSMDAKVPVVEMRTWQDQMQRALTHQWLGMMLSGILGVLALVLACLGIYSVTGYAVAQRQREFSIHMVLGCNPGALITEVLTHATRLMAIGGIAGFFLARAGARFLNEYIEGLPDYDAYSFLIVFNLLWLSSLIAAAIPAWRAVYTDPAITMKQS